MADEITTTGRTDGTADRPAHGARLRAYRPRRPDAALGQAVALLMTAPTFGALRFGPWARVLAGQVNRGDYLLVGDGVRVRGMAGWFYADRAAAEAWLAGRLDPSPRPRDGAAVAVCNIVAARDPAALRLVRRAAFRETAGVAWIYAKRVRADGSLRPLRLRHPGAPPG